MESIPEMKQFWIKQWKTWFSDCKRRDIRQGASVVGAVGLSTAPGMDSYSMISQSTEVTTVDIGAANDVDKPIEVYSSRMLLKLSIQIMDGCFKLSRQNKKSKGMLDQLRLFSNLSSM